MSVDEQVSVFTQNYSLPKTVIAEALLLIGAVLPLTPSFAANAHYTRFLYAWPFFPIVVVSCLVLGLLALAMIPVLWRALTRRPAIEICGEQIVVHSNWEMRAKLS